MEHCQGGELKTLLDEQDTSRFEETVVQRWGYQLACGIKKMNDLNIVHRDLKLENLLLSKKGCKGNIKIADLGLSRNLADGSVAVTICGTPLYSAPEVLAGDFYNYKADMWSFGAILYELMTGVAPFNAMTVPELRKMQRVGITFFYNLQIS